MAARAWASLSVAACLALVAAACSPTGVSSDAQSEGTRQSVIVTVVSGTSQHRFTVDAARTEPEQQQGLMFRTEIPPDGGMLFWPYPPDGGQPRIATFWMKNTPTPLDIIFIRKDGSIARIAENTIPFSEAPVSSVEPIAAVLELRGGRTAELGIAEDDQVRWQRP